VASVVAQPAAASAKLATKRKRKLANQQSLAAAARQTASSGSKQLTGAQGAGGGFVSANFKRQRLAENRRKLASANK